MVKSPKVQQGPRVVAVTKRKSNEKHLHQSSKQNHTKNSPQGQNSESKMPPTIVYSMDSFGNIQITSGSSIPKISPKTNNDPPVIGDQLSKTNDHSQSSNHSSSSSQSSASSSKESRKIALGEGTFHLVEHVDDKEEDKVSEDGDKRTSSDFKQNHNIIANDTHDSMGLQSEVKPNTIKVATSISTQSIASSSANRSQHQPHPTPHGISVTATRKSPIEYENGLIKRPDNLVARTHHQSETLQQAENISKKTQQPVSFENEAVEHLNSKGHRPPPVTPKPKKEEILLKKRNPSELVDENGDPLYAPVTKATKTSKLKHSKISNTINHASSDRFDEETIPVGLSKSTQNHFPNKSTTSEVSVFSDSGFSSDVSPIDPFLDEPIYAMPESSPTETTAK